MTPSRGDEVRYDGIPQELDVWDEVRYDGIPQELDVLCATGEIGTVVFHKCRNLLGLSDNPIG